MRVVSKVAPMALLLSLAVLMSGCGWFKRDAAEQPTNARSYLDSPDGRDFSTLNRALGIYFIYDVDPAFGPLAGGDAVTLTGSFPDFAGVENVYSVRFGANLAAYDTAFADVFSSTAIHVTTPPGTAPGLVDVTLLEQANGIDTAILPDAYRYLDAFDIAAIVPDRGPLPGMQPVTIFGSFPVSNSIYSIAEASSSYLIYIDGKFAPFNSSILPNPIITTDRIYALTPPGDAAGLVDVAAVDALYAIELFDNANSMYNFALRVLPDSYEYLETELSLTDADLDIGFILGNEPVRLEGRFPVDTTFISMADFMYASQSYTVYFGGNVAPFDSSIIPVITQRDAFVVSPRGNDVGFVDLEIVDNLDTDTFARLENGYRYYSMLIAQVYPAEGPDIGGTPVRIDGIFATDAITMIADAYASYRVFFDGIPAPFDISANPIVTAFAGFDSISGINEISTIYNSIYVITPPHAPGLVDVTVAHVPGKDLPATLTDGYLYLDEVTDNVGDWMEAEVLPNVVGPLAPGDLLVRVKVSETIDANNGDSVFIVPQGGDPTESTHRIALQVVPGMTGTDTNGNFDWYGTNVERLSTDMFGGEIYPDGHAAIYIETPQANSVDFTILGDDFTSPYTDGGRILNPAHLGRHFLIDTIPPRMVIENARSLAWEYIFEQPGTDITNANIVTGIQNIYHPFLLEISSDFPQAYSTVRAPVDMGGFLDNASTSAQIFFNTGSIANNLHLPPSETDLRFQARVLFQDDDLYTTLSITEDELRDVNRFLPTGAANALVRQVAGFDSNAAPIYTPLIISDGSFDELLFTGDDVLIRWDIQAGAFGAPSSGSVDLRYESFAPLSPVAGATELFENGNIIPQSRSRLEAVWNFDEGIPADVMPLIYQLPVKFRGADRAGNYYPQGDISENIVKVFTPTSRTLPALTIWWMRDTQVAIEESGIPASEITKAPAFRWGLTSNPRPFTRGLPNPVFSFSIWTEVNTSGTLDQRRNGTFEPVINTNTLSYWSFWTADQALPQVVLNSLTPGRWYIVVVAGIDEAGNVSQWPYEDLVFTSLDANGFIINPIFDVAEGPTSAGQKNWSRFFLESSETVVETQVTSNFFHEVVGLQDGVAGNGERALGSIEIVPIPGASSGLDVTATFDVQITIPDSASLDDAFVDYELINETTGNPVATGTVQMNGARRVQIPATGSAFISLGNVTNRKPPFNYVFRAWAGYDSNGNTFRDSTPANIRFVVVEDVQSYIQNSNSQGNQPIKEVDRP